jgi:phosphatidylethanolamine/phosphatidyl-N-methylethanolamine N-methyltransferase
MSSQHLPSKRKSSYRVFLEQFWKRYHTTGAILPSGRRLSKALCRYAAELNGTARQILEVGPGTGPATVQLVRLLATNDDHLRIVELNDDFVEYLRQRFANEPEFQQVADRCEIIHDRLENLPQDTQYDVIVSGLPLNNFPVELVESLLGCFERLLKPGGVVSFFEYIAIRRAKAAVSGRHDRERLQGISRLIDHCLLGREIRRDSVLLNVPPAWVHHVRKV